MYSTVLVFLAAIAGAQSQGGVPIGPINGLTATIACANPLSFVADGNSACHFYQCSVDASGGSQLKLKRCGLGSFIANNFVMGTHNPCTERFPIMGVYDCSRVAGPITCGTVLNCTNGATLRQEGSLCWCNCSQEWQGAPDCSIRKASTPAPPTNYPCPNGTPLDDFCAKAGSNGCKNGGICINQCTNFVCNCTVPYPKDKLCNI